MKSSLRIAVGPRALVAALAALLPLGSALPVQAAFADTLDQAMVQVFANSYQDSVPYMAQTFTAGVSGQIDRVSLPLSTPQGFAMWTVSLNTVGSNGAPTATQLGAAPPAIGSTRCCQFNDYAFNPAIAVTGGAHYAIVVQVAVGNVRWLDGGFIDRYSGGRQYIGGSATSWLTTGHGDFGFKEWVASNVNSAPVVGVDNTAVSVTEGAAASNSGTCSDPDGDTVTLRASDGTVSACSGGKFTWSKAAGDEAAPETVTITADDGSGLTTSTAFTFDVAAVDPTAQILSDPPSITVPEGTSVPFTGSATSPAAPDNSAGFSYAWTVSVNGAAYATGSGASFGFVPKDDGSYLVTFSATDDGGMSGTTSMTVIATNVAPAAKINSVAGTTPLVTTPYEFLTFSGSFTDVDTADSYTMTWNFGDGTTATGLNVAHAYSAPRTYTVTFQVSDGEGGVGTSTTTVVVQTTAQALSSIEAYVQGLSGLNQGQKNSLTVKLQNAAAKAARGDNNAAANELDAFLNELQADVNTGKVSAGAAASLRTAVNAVRGSLGTFNRLVEWWPLEA